MTGKKIRDPSLPFIASVLAPSWTSWCAVSWWLPPRSSWAGFHVAVTTQSAAAGELD